RTMLRLAGSPLYMPMAYYREAWQRGEIRREHLLQAMGEVDPACEEAGLLAALDAADPVASPLLLLSDVVDSRRDISHEPTWPDTIVQQITQFCAAYFDRDQADWHPDRRDGFYAGWRRVMAHDHHVSLLMHAPEIRRRVHDLPDDAGDLFTWVLDHLAVSPDHVPELLHVLMLRINGWAAWCAYMRWQARLGGEDDAHIVELLAIRLAWEYLIDNGDRSPESAWAQWQEAWATLQEQPEAGTDPRAVWQRAQELAYQRSLAQALQVAAPAPRERVSVQAAFCIDVRSEVFRRAWETVDPGVQTYGMAGHFGLPIRYRPIGTDATWPLMPGLMAPSLQVTDTSGDPARDRAIADARRAKLDVKESWQPFYRLPGSAFTLVESLGLSYLSKLFRRSLPTTDAPEPFDRLGLDPAKAQGIRPKLVLPGEDVSTRAELAAGVLRTMGLTHGFARLVLLVGHGGQSINNPHAAGLDCGACGGQTGEVNARTLSGLLNDPAVRRALRDEAIHLPESTYFLPALHNTTTDEVALLDRERVPASHGPDLQQLEQALVLAGERARAERAPSLGLAHLVPRPKALLKALRARGNDWAQTRPEWGQANNAAFIVAPRARSRELDLNGRAFLHDYDHRHDADLSVLEQIMTGPMIVSHWINMQYYASTVDIVAYGSGNKVLHNVVGGRIGVFEGNGGDLRIGLSLQSVHDGEHWVHTPLRLSVFLEAPREAIGSLIAKHAVIRQLVEHRWLHLFRLEGAVVETFADGQWQAWPDALSSSGPSKV
ncbi:MAG TPA: DUF2309 domain-containing protein, partial [Stenomitos sp.]